MTYVKTYLPTLKTHVVNLKRDANDLSRDLQRLEVRGKLGSKTLYCRLQIPSDTLNYLFSQQHFSPKDYYFFHISQPSKICMKNRYFEEQIHWVPLKRLHVFGKSSFLRQ